MKIKIDINKILHIIILLIGTAFLLIPSFHTNLWFDESYSVGLANHSFFEIISIDSHDVHPFFYYWVLHFLNLILGHKIIIYRLFSVFCTTSLGIIGYTHIRKDFGEKIGIVFSFLVFFSPVFLMYSSEIRMYTLCSLLVTITAIYAYRIYLKKDELIIKNWTIFTLFSILSSYTHYYALLFCGLINLSLFVYFIVLFKNTKKLSSNIIAFIISGFIQIFLYIPWIFVLLSQVSKVSSGFWINIKFPDTLLDILVFPFMGNLTEYKIIPIIFQIIFSLFIIIYIVVLYFKNRSIKSQTPIPGIFSIFLFLGTLILSCIASLIIRRPIIYPRYLFCVIGLFFFFIAYTFVKLGNKYINCIFGLVLISISLLININLININYNVSNLGPLEYVENDISENDIIIMSNNGNGYIISVNNYNNISYLYDKELWLQEEAYKAFSRDFRTIYNFEFLENYSGKIWLINEVDYSLYDEINNLYNLKLIKSEYFKTNYKNCEYYITLVEK